MIHGLRRSSGEGNGNPLQYSCLENSMDREAWWATIHTVAELDTSGYLFRSLEGFFFPFYLSCRIYCTKPSIFSYPLNVCGIYNSVPSLITDSCSFSKFLDQFRVRSDQISRSVMSDSLRPHESQHDRPPCPSPTPGVRSDSCPSSQ